MTDTMDAAPYGASIGGLSAFNPRIQTDLNPTGASGTDTDPRDFSAIVLMERSWSTLGQFAPPSLLASAMLDVEVISAKVVSKTDVQIALVWPNICLPRSIRMHVCAQ